MRQPPELKSENRKSSFERRLTELWDEEDLSRELARRRTRALALLDERGSRWSRRWLAALPALLVLAWLAGTTSPWQHSPRRERVVPLHGYEIVLTGPASPSFYRRLDFYRWLAHHEERHEERRS